MWGPPHEHGVFEMRGKPGPTYAGGCGTRGPRPVGGPGPPRALSGRAESGMEERRMRAGWARDAEAACALSLGAVRGAPGTGAGPEVHAAAERTCPLLTGRRQELPGRYLAHVWSQRHPPTWGSKGLDSPATPVVAVLRGGRAWVFRAGLGCLQGAASELPGF